MTKDRMHTPKLSTASEGKVKSSLAKRARSVICLNRFVAPAFIIILAALSGACNNTINFNRQKLLPSYSNTKGPLYTISRVSVDSTGAGSSGPGTALILFDSSNSSGPINKVCSIGTGTNSAPCVCEFNWVSYNTVSGPALSVPRKDYTEVFEVQSNAVKCPQPLAFAQEKPGSESVEVTVRPANGNPNSFYVPLFNLSQGDGEGDFSDIQGRSFVNILRYSCFEKTPKVLGLTNKSIPARNNSGATQQIRLASVFCTSSGGVHTECAEILPNEISSQSYYYNLYIRSTDKGGINEENNRFRCPRVEETLESTFSSGSVASDFWPLDSNFALAVRPNADFSVGVEAYSKLGNDADPSTQSNGCYGDAVGAADSNSLSRSCIGFAAKPNLDGSCPMIQRADGSVLPTYRLRRYVVLYPPQFDNTGKMLNEPYSVDTIYVVDRPVNEPTENPIGAFSMKGPKPCPFAFYDHSGVIGNTPAYYGTNSSGWDGKNVDGIRFPNFDGNMGTIASCSAALAIPDKNLNAFSIATTHRFRQQDDPLELMELGIRLRDLRSVPVRPIQSWAPHYEEDTNFQACAPLSDPFIDPPLHFKRNPETGNIAWCAEAYPTKNPYVDATSDPRSFYTSHLEGGSDSDTCSRTLTTNQPGNLNDGQFFQRCDRTVRTPSVDWFRFPLLAPAPEIEAALESDPSFECRVSFDNRQGKAGLQSPSEGCCGSSVMMDTGLPGVGSPNVRLQTNEAHLEPDAACRAPTY